MWYRIKQWLKTLGSNKNPMLDTYGICDSEAIDVALERTSKVDMSRLTPEQANVVGSYFSLIEKQITLHKKKKAK